MLNDMEIERRGRDLAKAAASETPATLLELIAALRDGVRASEETLRRTKIGVTVNKLKQHKDATVARQAGELVGKWRRDIKEHGPGGKPGSSPVNGGSGNGAGKKENKGAAGEGKGLGKVTVPPEQRSAKADGVDTEVTGVKGRDNCLKLIYDGLAYMSEQQPSAILPLAVSIESAAFSLLGPETSESYRTKMRSLFTNLKNKSNPQLRQRLLAAEISPNRFVRMTNDELKSPERLAEEKAMAKENMDNAMVAQEVKSISLTMVCGNCKMKKVSYTQAQTRSADEPMTTFCHCQNCGNRWKFC